MKFDDSSDIEELKKKTKSMLVKWMDMMQIMHGWDAIYVKGGTTKSALLRNILNCPLQKLVYLQKLYNQIIKCRFIMTSENFIKKSTGKVAFLESVQKLGLTLLAIVVTGLDISTLDGEEEVKGRVLKPVGLISGRLQFGEPISIKIPSNQTTLSRHTITTQQFM